MAPTFVLALGGSPAAAAQRFRNSLTEQQRAELDALAQQAFG